MPKVLNVGGGTKAVGIPDHYNGWEHLLLDIAPGAGVDVVCDARLLGEKFPRSSYDAIYCAHNLEDYYGHDVIKVLTGFVHVLSDEGFAEIRVPDIGELIRLMASASLDIDHAIYKGSAGAITAHDMIYGYGPEIEQSGRDFYAHKTGFSRSTLAKALLSNGFAEVYFSTPMAALELRVFAFKLPASERSRAGLSLGQKFDAAPDSPKVDRSADVEPAQEAVGTDRVDELYSQAVAAWDGGQWATAADLISQAIRLDRSLPALHYLLGCCRLELDELGAAATDFDACLSRKPPYPMHSQARARRALCLARHDLQAGIAPELKTIAAQDRRSVSVVICSVSPGKFDRAAAMYRRLLAGIPLQIIRIGDARSLAEGYNRGLALAENEVVVFAHDDVEVVSPDLCARLLSGLARHDVVGVAGTRRIKGGAWHFAGHPYLQGQVGMPADAGYVVTLYDVSTPSSRNILALDGLLIAARREVALRIGFDGDNFDGWHLYDLDFSYRASQAGLDCATCNDILVVHGSQGNYGEDWLKYSQRFLAKHSLDRGEAIFYSPELISLPVRSVEEWRMLTQRLLQ